MENELAVATVGSEELLLALNSKNAKTVNDLIESMYPIDLALLLQEFDDDSLSLLYNFLSDEKLAQILEQADEDLQDRMTQLLDNYRIMYLFNYMSKDDVVDILGDLPVNRRKIIVNLMKSGERKVIQDLLGYAEDSAGGIMTTEYIALSAKLTVIDAIEKIREIAPKTEVIDTIFILDSKKQLVGTVDLRDIFTADDRELLEHIMNPNVISVDLETDQEEVSQLVSKYDLKTIPVVNKRHAMLGIITVDDIIDVIVEEHTEDILKLGGVGKEENINSSLTDSIKMRLPWLLVNLVTAFLACFTVEIFSGTIEQVVALASAMPIVAGMGGNAGTQTLTIMIRSITLGEVKLRESWKPLLKEILLGLINGLIIGVITAVVLYFMYGNIYLGVIMITAMVGNLIIAGLFGFILPLLLKSLKADPALASGVFLTTATDVFGFFIFLGLAQLFLPLLL